MARYLRHAVLSAFAALALAVPAHASTIYTSTFDPSPDVKFDKFGGSCTGTNYEDATADTVTGDVGGLCSDLTYGHTLVGYTPGTDTLLSAGLDLFFYDDVDPAGGNGNPDDVHIELDSCIYTACVGDVALNGGTTTTIHYNVFSEVQADGSLAVFLAVGQKANGQNDFFLDKSVLNGEWDSDIQFIPEPASLLLFGTGFAAVAARVRRARNRA